MSNSEQVESIKSGLMKDFDQLMGYDANNEQVSSNILSEISDINTDTIKKAEMVGDVSMFKELDQSKCDFDIEESGISVSSGIAEGYALITDDPISTDLSSFDDLSHTATSGGDSPCVIDDDIKMGDFRDIGLQSHLSQADYLLSQSHDTATDDKQIDDVKVSDLQEIDSQSHLTQADYLLSQPHDTITDDKQINDVKISDLQESDSQAHIIQEDKALSQSPESNLEFRPQDKQRCNEDKSSKALGNESSISNISLSESSPLTHGGSTLPDEFVPSGTTGQQVSKAREVEDKLNVEDKDKINENAIDYNCDIMKDEIIDDLPKYDIGNSQDVNNEIKEGVNILENVLPTTTINEKQEFINSSNMESSDFEEGKFGYDENFAEQNVNLLESGPIFESQPSGVNTSVPFDQSSDKEIHEGGVSFAPESKFQQEANDYENAENDFMNSENDLIKPENDFMEPETCEDSPVVLKEEYVIENPTPPLHEVNMDIASEQNEIHRNPLQESFNPAMQSEQTIHQEQVPSYREPSHQMSTQVEKVVLQDDSQFAEPNDSENDEDAGGEDFYQSRENEIETSHFVTTTNEDGNAIGDGNGASGTSQQASVKNGLEDIVGKDGKVNTSPEDFEPIIQKDLTSTFASEIPTSPPQASDMPIIFHNDSMVDLILWRNVVTSSIVFGVTMSILLSLVYMSFISVVAYSSLTLLTGTISFRLYKSVMQTIQKSEGKHPFNKYLEFDTNISSEKAEEIKSVLLTFLNSTFCELKRLFFVQDIIASIKFGCLLWVLTYLGSWFNGLTLIILFVMSMFTLPKVYFQNQAQIDPYIDVARTRVNEVMTKVRAAIPIGNKEKAQ